MYSSFQSRENHGDLLSELATSSHDFYLLN